MRVVSVSSSNSLQETKFFNVILILFYISYVKLIQKENSLVRFRENIVVWVKITAALHDILCNLTTLLSYNNSLLTFCVKLHTSSDHQWQWITSPDFLPCWFNNCYGLCQDAFTDSLYGCFLRLYQAETLLYWLLMEKVVLSLQLRIDSCSRMTEKKDQQAQILRTVLLFFLRALFLFCVFCLQSHMKIQSKAKFLIKWGYFCALRFPPRGIHLFSVLQRYTLGFKA